MPNAKLANTHIDNYGLRRYRRFDTHIAVPYNTPPSLTEAFIEGLRKIVAYHPYIRKDKHFIYLEGIYDSTLKILFCVYFNVSSRDKELQCRHEVLSDIIKLADLLGIRLAFPTQTLHIETFPAKASSPPPYTTTPKVLQQKLQDFLKGKNNGAQLQ